MTRTQDQTEVAAAQATLETAMSQLRDGKYNPGGGSRAVKDFYINRENKMTGGVEVTALKILVTCVTGSPASTLLSFDGRCTWPFDDMLPPP